MRELLHIICFWTISFVLLVAILENSLRKKWNLVSLRWTRDTPTYAVANRTTGYVDHQGMGMRPQFAIGTKWALGLQFQAHPREIMTEVLKALQKLNVCWKNIGHYNMKCRWVPRYADHSDDILKDPMYIKHSFGDESSFVESDDAIGNSTNVVKFEVQLYKTKDDNYLLDLQRISGSQFLFLDLSAAFVAHLSQ